MKSLLELEQNMRALEKELDGLRKQAAEMRESLEVTRNADNGEDAIDFTKINLLARYVPFPSHPLVGQDEQVKHFYLIMLLYVVRLDAGAEANQKRLIFSSGCRKYDLKQRHLEKPVMMCKIMGI